MDPKKVVERREQRLERENQFGIGQVAIKYLYTPSEGAWSGRVTIEGVLFLSPPPSPN